MKKKLFVFVALLIFFTNYSCKKDNTNNALKLIYSINSKDSSYVKYMYFFNFLKTKTDSLCVLIVNSKKLNSKSEMYCIRLNEEKQDSLYYLFHQAIEYTSINPVEKTLFGLNPIPKSTMLIEMFSEVNKINVTIKYESNNEIERDTNVNNLVKYINFLVRDSKFRIV